MKQTPMYLVVVLALYISVSHQLKCTAEYNTKCTLQGVSAFSDNQCTTAISNPQIATGTGGSNCGTVGSDYWNYNFLCQVISIHYFSDAQCATPNQQVQSQLYLGKDNCEQSPVLTDTWIKYAFVCEKPEENGSTAAHSLFNSHSPLLFISMIFTNYLLF